MYKYSDSSFEKVGICDCFSTKLKHDEKSLTLEFEEGFFILTENSSKWQSTGMSEVTFYMDDTERDISIELLISPRGGGDVILTEMPLQKLEQLMQNGAKPEIFGENKENDSYLFEGAVYYRGMTGTQNCQIKITAKKITYRWNEIMVIYSNPP